jgi:hypothetical protein
MSENVSLSPEPIEPASGDALESSQSTRSTVVRTEPSEPGAASTPIAAPPAGAPAEAQVLLELVARGLAPDADDTTRAAARDLWTRFAQTVAPMMSGTSAMPNPPAAPAAPTMPSIPAMPAASAMPGPSPLHSPIAMAARALRQLPPDQLLDLLLQRLRAALPADAAIPSPGGIQFRLLPAIPHGAR